MNHFYESGYGRAFFSTQLPNLVRAIEKLSTSITDSRQPLAQEVELNPQFLRDLYRGDYEPLNHKKQIKELIELNHRVADIENSLRQMIFGFPKDLTDSFDAYLDAISERNSAEMEQAFEAGYQTAINMLVAGLVPPEEQTHLELPLTIQELRNMNGETVYCLEMNDEVQVIARKRGSIKITTERETLRADGLTLFRKKPASLDN